MLLPYVLLFLPVLVAAQESSRSMKTLDHERMLRTTRNALDWIGESFLNVVDTLLPDSKSRSVEGTH